MKSILRYIGNMSNIDITPYIMDGCKAYVEPFAGSFGAGFNVMEQKYIPRIVLNDKDYFVYNFWLCVRDDVDFLMDTIRNLYKKIEHLDYVDAMKVLDIYSKSKNKYEQAAYEFLYMENKVIFGNNKDYIKELRIDDDKFIDTSIRLLETDILNLDYLDVFDKWDNDDTFFMIDPPYNVPRINSYYRGNCSEFDHAKLRERLRTVRGKWIVRYNKEDLTADLYRDTRVLFETNKSLFGTEYVEVYYTNM